MIDSLAVVERSPWVFRSDTQDARPVDLSRWSTFDIRYRGVFRTLQKVPAFANGLYEDVCDAERVSAASVSQTTLFQDQVVYALLSELFEMMDLRHAVNGDKSFFFLRYVTRPVLVIGPLTLAISTGPDCSTSTWSISPATARSTKTPPPRPVSSLSTSTAYADARA